jgi:hypothetical protein
VEEGVISGQIASTHGQITSEVSENWDRPSVMESKTPVRTVRELSIERNLNFWRILGKAAADWDWAKRAGGKNERDRTRTHQNLVSLTRSQPKLEVAVVPKFAPLAASARHAGALEAILGAFVEDCPQANLAGVEMGDGLGATGWGWVSPGPPPWPS